MKRVFSGTIALTVLISAFLLLYGIRYISSFYPLTHGQVISLGLIIVVLATVAGVSAFEYYYTSAQKKFINDIRQSLTLSESLGQNKQKRYPVEFQKILYAVEEINKENLRKIKEYESKAGYSDAYYNHLSTISHQLRTPITGLKWALGIISDDVKNQKPIDKEMISEASEALARIGSIIEDLLIGVNEGKALKKKPEPFDIERGIGDVIAESSLLAKEHNIKISVKKNISLLPLVLGVPYELRFVLHTIISNAIFYSKEHSTVVVALELEGESVVIHVTNIGIPISGDTTIIFSQFGRTAEAMRANPNGTGLGLYLSKRIVTSLGGTINFISNAKNGTTFTVKLPISHKGQLETSVQF